MIEIPSRYQSGDKPPKLYCPNHGVEMVVSRRTQHCIATGREYTYLFVSKCPRWFCLARILTGIVGPAPDSQQAKRDEANG